MGPRIISLRTLGSTLKLEIINGPAALEQIHAALEAFWRKHEQVPQHIRNEIGVATAEIAANILEHARAVTLWMELHARPDAVEVEFTDAGEPANLDLAAAIMPDEMAESGRGLALAQGALRLLSYFRDEFGNHWRLVSNAFLPGRLRGDAAEEAAGEAAEDIAGDAAEDVEMGVPS